MTDRPLACLVLAGGRGTRMRSTRKKELHTLLGRPILSWVLAALEPLEPDWVGVVVPPGAGELDPLLPPGATAVVQQHPRGTGDAAAAARDALAGFAGDLLIANGDHPLTEAESLAGLLAAHRAAGAEASVLSFERTPSIGADFGRVVRAPSGAV